MQSATQPATEDPSSCDVATNNGLAQRGPWRGLSQPQCTTLESIRHELCGLRFAARVKALFGAGSSAGSHACFWRSMLTRLDG